MNPRLTPLKAIRWNCLDCMTGSSPDVRECDLYDCSLWEYRLGSRPTKEMIEKVKDEGMLKGKGYAEPAKPIYTAEETKRRRKLGERLRDRQKRGIA